MKKLESEGNDYYWLAKKKYPAAVGLMMTIYVHYLSTGSLLVLDSKAWNRRGGRSD
jgi:hypothetical protein